MSGNQEMLLSPEMLMQMRMFPLETLLVIDRDGKIAAQLQRELADIFRYIWVVSNVEEARKLLNNSVVMYLICNYFLGENEPNGFEIVSTIRSEFESLKRCLVIADSDAEIEEVPSEVDAVFPKTVSARSLVGRLIEYAD